MSIDINFRQLGPKDNLVIASIIRQTFIEFNMPQKGTVYSDPTTNNLYKLFDKPDAEYWVVEKGGEVVGGCGVYPTVGLPEGCAELVKFYLSPLSRGRGIGIRLVNLIEERARNLGYEKLYIESFPGFNQAVRMYEKSGFRYLNHSLGKSGHIACTIFMIKDLVVTKKEDALLPE